MPVSVKYEVKKPFKYGGKIRRIGDEFIPEGGKWDKYLMSDDSPFVRKVEYQLMPEEVKNGQEADSSGVTDSSTA